MMPAVLPVVLTAVHLVLTAHEVPKLNYEPSCRVAADALVSDRSTSTKVCLQDERRARATLQKQWKTYSRTERMHCQRLTTLGGPPSYVELLTCLQMAKDAAKAPNVSGLKVRVER